jgi:hypothetical protein
MTEMVVEGVSTPPSTFQFETPSAPLPVASVPQYSAPPVVDFTSQEAAERDVTPKVVVVALVMVALVPKRFAKERSPVNVGDALKTRFPEPVLSVTRESSSVEVSIEEEETLLLNRFQWVDERYPSVPTPDCVIENAPVLSLYARGAVPERAVVEPYAFCH